MAKRVFSRFGVEIFASSLVSLELHRSPDSLRRVARARFRQPSKTPFLDLIELPRLKNAKSQNASSQFQLARNH